MLSRRCAWYAAQEPRGVTILSRAALPWINGKDQRQALDGGASLRNPRKEARDEVFGPRPDGTSWASQDPWHEFLPTTGELGGGGTL